MSLPAGQLPVGQILAESWRLLLGQPGAWCRAMLIPLVIELAVTYGFLSLYGPQLAAMTMGNPQDIDTPTMLRFLGMQICLLIAYVLFAVAWHRFTLIGPSEAPRALPTVQRRHMRFLATTIGVALLIGLAVMVPLMIIAALRVQSALVLIGVMILVFVLLVRWQLVFPAIAVERPLSLVASWRATRGHGFWLFWLLVLAVLPGVVVGFLLDQVFGAAQQLFVAFGTLSVPAALGYLASSLVSYATLAIAVSAVSGAYRRLVDGG